MKYHSDKIVSVWMQEKVNGEYTVVTVYQHSRTESTQERRHYKNKSSAVRHYKRIAKLIRGT